jgi:hypothetical protein
VTDHSNMAVPAAALYVNNCLKYPVDIDNISTNFDDRLWAYKDLMMRHKNGPY